MLCRQCVKHLTYPVDYDPTDKEEVDQFEGWRRQVGWGGFICLYVYIWGGVGLYVYIYGVVGGGGLKYIKCV
jgi:hypothetical protein